ncbi:hypothetical protein FHT40_002452 [Mycolicibacterium sp. BK556]|uniref:Shedu immune nuclease family protein n=1 Tax=unclassified Mycolicibacterium TaxID=2636767 RepID=UPI00160A344B|nr:MULTISPECIES: Shedu immune nuclease family protein [unclassified Mycolicibacterium]MBB3602791.1 hypothetical protein [Mycolicibacterium sp. BK556]MBB3632986.1 hypothetical protein [Mycolicibacterium sp. BK607]
MSDWIDVYGFGSDTEFNIEGGDFSTLEIRKSPKNDKFHYFYDTKQRRLITDFVLHEGPQVSTLCTVTLIYADGAYSPRLKFWKKDKRRRLGDATVTTEVKDEPRAHMIKAAVNIRDGHENLWKLINFLQSCKEISVPKEVFRVVSGDVAQLVEIFEASDKDTVLEAAGTVLAGKLTQQDLDLLANRKGELDRFHRLLTDDTYFAAEKTRLGKTRNEDVWQAFFEENPWIFGYGLNLISCESFDDGKLEKITTGADLFGGAGKRSDAVLRTRGVVSSLLFCEIKRHDTSLLAPQPYRKPDVYQPSSDVVGAVSQVQKTADKALRGIHDYVHRHFKADGTPTGIEVSTVRPRQVVVVGKTAEFEAGGVLNPEKMAAFEFYRRSVLDTEIITFDELYERARFIVGG